MIGLVVSYTTNDSKANVLLNHKLFGRIIKTKSSGYTVYYYRRGLLHDTKFKQLAKSIYFIANVEMKPELEKILDKYSTNVIKEDVRAFKEEELETGMEHWMKHAAKKGYRVRRWT